jgi:hypothetical protein
VLAQNFSYLDTKRLGKQRVECKQILNTLSGKSKGWRHHPAVLMWAGHEDMLRLYMDYCIMEWEGRGHKNSIPCNYEWVRLGVWWSCKAGPFRPPKWWGDHRITNSHQANLFRKDPAHYGKFQWHLNRGKPWRDLPYHWPVTREQVVLDDILQFCP